MIAPRPALTWVVGAGGLLGRSVSRVYASAGATTLWQPPAPIPWAEAARARRFLRAAAKDFVAHAAARGMSWRILWCAGAGVIATDPDRLSEETRSLEALLDGVAATVRPGDAAGSIFLASSAGGAYAGSPARAPYDEASAVGARSAYGQEKLQQESIVTAAAEAMGTQALIGRISNLFGSDQNPAKPQGLITQIGISALTRRPLRLYVPLDTIRDYVLATDAARLIALLVDRLERSDDAVVVRLVCSGVGTTVAAVLSTWRAVLGRPPGVIMASSPVTRLQPRALLFRPAVWPEVRITPTPLVIGVHAVYARLLSDLRMGAL